MCLHVCVSRQHVSIRAVLQHLVRAGIVGLFLASLRALVHQRYKKHHNTSHYRRNTSQIKRHIVVSKIVTKKSWERRQDRERTSERWNSIKNTVNFCSMTYFQVKKRIFNEGKVQALKFSLKRVFFCIICALIFLSCYMIFFFLLSLAHQSQTLLSFVLCVCTCVCVCVCVCVCSVLVYATLWHKPEHFVIIVPGLQSPQGEKNLY